MRKVCFRLSPGVRFSVDFVGESGDGVYLSLVSVRISAEISSLPLAMFARPVSEFVVDSVVSCSKSESGFLTRCSIGLLLIKPSGWRPLN